MAKKAVKTDFFPGSRREFRLNRYELLEVSVDGEERKRGKLSVEMPITGKDYKGMPGWIGNPFQEMLKEDSVTGTTKIEALCKGMTMDVFSTEKTRTRALSSTGVVLNNLQLVPSGEGDSRDIALHLVIYAPANQQLHEWVWDHIHKTFFAGFEYSQTEMDFDGAGEEEADSEDDDGELLPETRAAVAASKRTNGHANA